MLDGVLDRLILASGVDQQSVWEIGTDRVSEHLVQVGFRDPVIKVLVLQVTQEDTAGALPPREVWLEMDPAVAIQTHPPTRS